MGCVGTGASPVQAERSSARHPLFGKKSADNRRRILADYDLRACQTGEDARLSTNYFARADG